MSYAVRLNCEACLTNSHDGCIGANCACAPQHYDRPLVIAYTIYGSGGGRLTVTGTTLGEAILALLARLKDDGMVPKHAHVGELGYISFRGKTIGQIY